MLWSISSTPIPCSSRIPLRVSTKAGISGSVSRTELIFTSKAPQDGLFVTHAGALPLAPFPADVRAEVAGVVEKLWEVFVAEDCTLVEVNPLASTSAEASRATDFILFLTSEDSQKVLASYGIAATRKGAYADPNLRAFIPHLEQIRGAVEQARPRPIHPGHAEFSKAFVPHMKRMLEQGADLTTQFVDDLVQELVQRAPERRPRLVEVLEREEHQVSESRRQVQKVMDVLTAEVTRRYREGDADPSDLLPTEA